MTAKYLINRYYGRGPDRSYWVGCSDGGRQGMVMSQKFPAFFDGIVAGDPVYEHEALGLSESNGVEAILNVYLSNPALTPPGPTRSHRLRRSRPDRICIRRSHPAIRHCSRPLCCSPAMRWTASPTASSITAGVSCEVQSGHRYVYRLCGRIGPANTTYRYNVPVQRPRPACRLRKSRPLKQINRGTADKQRGGDAWHRRRGG